MVQGVTVEDIFDNVMAALELMDMRWPGYQNAKKIIRDEIVRLREEEKELNIYRSLYPAERLPK